MAVRRSARLRSRQPSSEEPQLPVDPVNHPNNSHTSNEEQTTKTHNTLPSVMERDETPVVDTPSRPKAAPTPATATAPSTSTNLRTPVKSAPPQPKPAATPSVAVNRGTPLKATPSQKTPSQKAPSQKTPSQKTPAQKPSVAKTPTSVLARPPHQEMHPSKVHQSTTKQADSGLILGFNPVKKDAEGKVVKESLGQDTPSKARPSPASTHFGTPGFEFKFSCHESQLSEEAKKLMETVREDAAKIKSQMTLDQKDDTPQQKDDQQAGDRRIAQPKGKTNRFSNAHMAEFKKMDSIAGHASAFRATPGRFQPVQKTLKRTTSKARLDESDKNSPAKAAASKPSIASPAVPTASSTKRVKHVKTDDTSTNRPAEGEPRTPSKPAQSRPRSTVRNSLMTPTAASAARTTYTSIKPPRASMIPSLARSPSLNQSSAPRTPRTDFNPRFKTNIPSLPNLKSILRRPHQPLFSKDPTKIAAGTHAAAPDFDSKSLMGSSRDASEDPVQTPSPKKRVEFSASTRSPAEASPSPSKAPAPAPQPISDIVYPTLPVLTPDHAVSKSANAEAKPTIRQVRPSDAAPATTPAPDVAGVPHGIGNKKRHRATEDEADAENVPPAEPASEARSTKRVKLSSPSPTKMPTPSPTKARTHTPMRSPSKTIRSGTPASARQRNRGVMSMSRLNMLAQPKNRP
ncbi:hypothetical protein P170DRAFT_428090 [Aspergillus steynii IBT 23096]|uniref:Erythromycin esterase n=1 Tax=Aspergillus steynii IBT 23096 TaxID=1392250 RepID=A0A2I2G1Q9_9EURO|nr:uncharacterized protein P170DRAFT_428090 [Aspergillus steynii IBT 23096]PLB46815.1 hypothetical protein P170DRAFT_428090 [Aspergillus steynii IBT 23096]